MKKHYIDKEELINEVLKHQEKIKEFYATFDDPKDVPKNRKHCIHLMSPRLVKMIQLLVRNIARSPSFFKKPYIEDAIAEGTLKALKYAKSFSFEYALSRNETPNPYGYFTRCIQQDFTNYCNMENKRTSQHLDYIIEEGRNMIDECPYEDRMIIRNAIKPLVEIR